MLFDPRQKLRTGRQALFCRNILCIAILRSIIRQRRVYHILSPEKKQVVTAGRMEGRPQQNQFCAKSGDDLTSNSSLSVRFQFTPLSPVTNSLPPIWHNCMLHTPHVQNSRFSACLRVVHKAEAAITCHHTQLGAMLKGVAGAIRTVSCLGTLWILCLVCLATRMSMWNFHAKYELRAFRYSDLQIQNSHGPSANLLDKLRISTSCHFEIPFSEEGRWVGTGYSG